MDDDGDGATAAPSEAFLSLQKELQEKEEIQRENEERARNETALAAEAATTIIRKVLELFTEDHIKWDLP